MKKNLSYTIVFFALVVCWMLFGLVTNLIMGLVKGSEILTLTMTIVIACTVLSLIFYFIFAKIRKVFGSKKENDLEYKPSRIFLYTALILLVLTSISSMVLTYSAGKAQKESKETQEKLTEKLRLSTIAKAEAERQRLAGMSTEQRAAEEKQKQEKISATLAAQALAVDAARQAKIAANLGSQWSYSEDSDAMSKGSTYHAEVLSTNTVNFNFPYSGEQHANLSFRTSPRHGKDVIFRIEKGQILCRSYEDCSILVRFDDEKATNYSAVGAADNSTNIIFIRNYDRFIGKTLKAKRVRISANIYQEGSPVFEFDVSGFNLNKYKSKSGR